MAHSKKPSRQARRKKYFWVIALSFIAVLLFLIIWIRLSSGSQAQFDTKSSDYLIAKLPKHSPSRPTRAVRLEDTSKPLPTNRWFSGLVFAEPSAPVYATPWSYQLTNTGFELSYNRPNSKPDVITAPHTVDLAVNLGAANSVVTSYDDLSLHLSHKNGDTTVATSRVTEGSPYVFISLEPHNAFTLTSSGQVSTYSDDAFLVKVGESHYAVTFQSEAVEATSSRGKLTFAAKGSKTIISLAVIPDDASIEDILKYSRNPITGTSTSYAAGIKTSTTFRLETANNKPTVFGLLPHHRQANNNAGNAGTLPTLRGKQTFKTGNSFRYELPASMPEQALITGKLSSNQRAELQRLLKSDVSQLQFVATDSYGAGKELYKAANLLQLSRELGMAAEQKQVQALLTRQLSMWFDPAGGTKRQEKYFYYDPAARGLVGAKPSYGSERFNDHHFHYGYFLYAAGLLAEVDKNFADRHKDMVNLLVRDIANPMQDSNFPKLRNFDIYHGHSWASGYSPFADGNNQESSSEAVNAWYGMYLWAQAVGSKGLANQSAWLYQNEQYAARKYWLEPDLSQPYFSGYRHRIFPLVWGGKLDYATWFSSTPEAKLGIQLIPMSPGQSYLGVNKARASQNISTLRAEQGGTATKQFKDYLVMYQSLYDPQGAQSQLASISPQDVDSANSYTYIYAWVYSQVASR